MKKVFTIIISLLIAFSFSFALVNAAPATPPAKDKSSSLKKSIQGNLGSFGKTSYGVTEPTPLPVMVANIIYAVLGLFGIILVIYMLFGGYTWMMAAGDQQKVTKAKDTIRNAIIGLIIISMAYAIATFVTSALMQSMTSK